MTTRKRDWQPERFDTFEEGQLSGLRPSETFTRVQDALRGFRLPFERNVIQLGPATTEKKLKEACEIRRALWTKDARPGFYISKDGDFDRICSTVSTMIDTSVIPFQEIMVHQNKQIDILKRLERTANGLDRFRFTEGIKSEIQSEDPVKVCIQQALEREQKARDGTIRQGSGLPLVTDAILKLANILFQRGAITEVEESEQDFVQKIANPSQYRRCMFIEGIFGALDKAKVFGVTPSFESVKRTLQRNHQWKERGCNISPGRV